jgi:hypothetical protein
MLIRDLMRRHPQAVPVLHRHGIDPTYAHLSIELAARSSDCRLEPLLAELRAASPPPDEPLRPAA